MQLNSNEFNQFVKDIKQKILFSQYEALKAVNKELKKSFPNMSGFSDTYQDKTFVQEVLAQLSWYNNLTIMQEEIDILEFYLL